MDHPIGLHLPSKVFMALIKHTGEGIYGSKTEAALSELILKWIATTKAGSCELERDKSIESVNSVNKGYQWKQLFLPGGTELRVTFRGHSRYARVEGEQIISDGAPTSPSRLANAAGCGTRSAWKTIWLRFPGTSRWQLAARCRDADC